jgi:UDP-glucose 4-epimerase
MNVLVTGGAGCVGSHLVEHLLAKGNKVLVIDNLATGRASNLPKNSNLEFVEGTIVDREMVLKVFEKFKPEVVIHAAAAYKDPNNWVEDTNTNALGTANVVQAAKAQDVKRFIYFQTALCYGTKPIEQPVSITHPIRPDCSYAISKTAGEQYIFMSGLDAVSFRLANVVGPRNLSGPLPTFYMRLTQNKPLFVMDTRRDFLFVQDLCEVVMKAVEGQGASGAYHVSSGSDVSIKELYEAVVDELGMPEKKNVEVRPRGVDDAFTILLDPSKTNQTFNWKTKTPLKDIVKAAVAWYKVNPIEQTFTHLKLPTDKKA